MITSPRHLRNVSTTRLCRALLVTGLAGACLSGVAYARSFGTNSKNILLKHVQYAAPQRPTVVLIHGMDSAKDTWSSFADGLQKREIDSIALDLRGHGESALGNPDDFSCSQIASDIRFTLDALDVQKPFVLLGHSMGGKVVIEYTAKYPEDVRTLLIEDMHHWAYDKSTKLDDAEAYERRKDFDRSFPSYELLSSELQKFGYAEERLLNYKSTGRIFQKEDGSWWSNINPFAQLLGWRHILKRNHLSHLENIINNFNIPVHLYYANWEHSVCKKQAVVEMKEMGVNTTQFEDAFHSIHNTQMEDMLNAVEEIVKCAQCSRQRR